MAEFDLFKWRHRDADQFPRADDLQARRIEDYRQAAAAPRRAQDAPEVRVLAVPCRGFEGLQGRITANFAESLKVYALETADPLSKCV